MVVPQDLSEGLLSVLLFGTLQFINRVPLYRSFPILTLSGRVFDPKLVDTRGGRLSTLFSRPVLGHRGVSIVPSQGGRSVPDTGLSTYVSTSGAVVSCPRRRSFGRLKCSGHTKSVGSL